MERNGEGLERVGTREGKQRVEKNGDERAGTREEKGKGNDKRGKARGRGKKKKRQIRVKRGNIYKWKRQEKEK